MRLRSLHIINKTYEKFKIEKLTDFLTDFYGLICLNIPQNDLYKILTKTKKTGENR